MIFLFMADAIEVSDISKSFKGDSGVIKALESVSLDIKEGEIYGLLGPNGAGKTTLISVIVGIVTPDSGSASVLGFDCLKRSGEVKKRINVVSGFTGVLQSLTCEQALHYYGMLYSIPRIDARAKEVMGEVGLAGFGRRLTEDLSSGMKQRFMIAKALLNDPKVLIMDEPTVGLDVESAISIRSMVKDLRKKGRTILLTTHNMFEAEELCDRIAFINKGRIIARGTPKGLKSKIISKRRIEVHCSKEDCVVDSLSGIKGVAAKVRSPQMVSVEVDEYGKMKKVLKALAGCDSEIFGVSELEPTFEETYLKLINAGGNDG